MGRPNDSPDVKASKGLAYILRHGAEKEGLEIRSDGYLKLNDVLARPKMRDVDTAMVLRLVAENAKQRFELFYGYDPSPPRPKVKKGQGKGKGKSKPVHGAGQASITSVTESSTSANPSTTAEAVSGGDAASSDVGEKQIDAAQLDDLSKELAKAKVSTELPLVEIPRPDDEPELASATQRGEHMQPGEWFIRATQGHSIKLESDAHLTPVTDDEEGRKRAGVCVHGTRWELWEILKSTGLSRMERTHIHLAPALSDHPILPRPNSTLRIYLDPSKLIAAGIPLYTSLNGVVLTPGNERGVVEKEHWSKAERKVDGRWVDVWIDGKEIQQY